MRNGGQIGLTMVSLTRFRLYRNTHVMHYTQKLLFSILFLTALPVPALAAFPATMEEFVNRVNDAIINPILALIFVAALLYFFWGGIMFLLNADNATARTEGKSHMFWGIIGMTVMVSVYALLAIGLGTFNVAPPTSIPLESWL